MRVEILEVSTVYPSVYLIEEGSFVPESLSAKIICQLGIEDAQKMKNAINKYDEMIIRITRISKMNSKQDFTAVRQEASRFLALID
jgi:hypothetical protein